ncbi:hypothetical protein [Mycobacterium paraterrae]|uniref:DUF3099 domain-containing protein n=1 Tax=Mycobacterium paraterrae TaxID=577492 RepID=A0ABY3VJE3_9MYCO|nr:hypothetical protein [Mycobacterium paraterrae]UMB68587.1 hypothetical protein MKK62_19550 [Mycobacterium paraterrae]
MPNSEANEPEATDRLIDKMWRKRAELLWCMAAVIALLSVVRPVVLIGAALVIATIGAAWMGFHELMTRADRDDAERPVAPLRPQADPRQPGTSAPHAPWQGGHAA